MATTETYSGNGNGLDGMWGVRGPGGLWLDAARTTSAAPEFRGWTDRECDAARFADEAHAGRAIAALGLADARPWSEDRGGEPRRWSVSWETGGSRYCEVVLARSARRAASKVRAWQHPVSIEVGHVSEVDAAEPLSDWPGAANI
jgi:hypothetical protein